MGFNLAFKGLKELQKMQ